MINLETETDFLSKRRPKKEGIIVRLEEQGLLTIPYSTFEKYRQCLGFDLSRNMIELTDELCFELRFIRYLNLSDNQLESLPHDIHLMENLVHFDVSNNNISKLPVAVKDMKHLVWFDLRENPFATRWCKLNHIDEADFDPQQFAVQQIAPFMEAVKAKHEILCRARAQNFRDYLIICPKGSKSSRKFYREETSFKNCPFRDIHLRHSEKFLQTLQTFEECKRKPYSYPDAWVFWAFNYFLRAIPWITGAFIIFCLLMAAFFEEKDFKRGLDVIDNFMPRFLRNSLISGHRGVFYVLPSRITSTFPIYPPVF